MSLAYVTEKKNNIIKYNKLSPRGGETICPLADGSSMVTYRISRWPVVAKLQAASQRAGTDGSRSLVVAVAEIFHRV